MGITKKEENTEEFLLDDEGLDLGEEKFLLDGGILSYFMASNFSRKIYIMLMTLILYIIIGVVISAIVYLGFNMTKIISSIIGGTIAIPILVFILSRIFKFHLNKLKKKQIGSN